MRQVYAFILTIQTWILSLFFKHARFIKLTSQGSESIISTSESNLPIAISNMRKIYNRRSIVFSKLKQWTFLSKVMFCCWSDGIIVMTKFLYMLTRSVNIVCWTWISHRASLWPHVYIYLWNSHNGQLIYKKNYRLSICHPSYYPF